MLRALKHIVRDQPLLRSGALRVGALLRSLARAEPGVYTLCYHHVAAAAAGGFSAQVAYLQRFGTFVDADTAAAALLSGEQPRGRRFVLTLDDGYADALDVALPVLRRHRVPATLFLVSDWLDRPPAAPDRARGYMTRADVGTWLAAGLDIGSHTATHPQVSRLDRAAAAAEFATSFEVLSGLAGKPVRHLACPWGVAGRDYRPARDPLLASEAGYATFFTTRRGVARDRADLLRMPRHVLEPEWRLHELDALLGGRNHARV